jgi:hypothetical protein
MVAITPTMDPFLGSEITVTHVEIELVDRISVSIGNTSKSWDRYNLCPPPPFGL